MIVRSWLTLMIFSMSFALQAKVDTYQFDDPQQEATYKKAIAELRCLVCQNQNLADSNAELAQDMRKKTYEMVTEGKSVQQIADFMVARYGDFVLYRPPVKSTTVFLWYGPVILLVLGAVIVIVFVRKQKRLETVIPEQQQKRAQNMLDDD